MVIESFEKMEVDLGELVTKKSPPPEHYGERPSQKPILKHS